MFSPDFLTSGQIVTGNTKVFVCTGDGTIRTFKEVAGGSVPVKDKDFTYSGNCEVIDDSTEMGVNWRIKFLTSGILKFADNIAIDVFLVGGGGGGRHGFTDKQGAATTVNRGAGGGGGGYTKTLSNIILTGDISYTIVIGDGGNYGSSGNGSSGGITSISDVTDCSVNGGNGGGNNSDNADAKSRGGDGGSGGGSGYFPFTSEGAYGVGGSDGSDGGGGTPGKGQGTTTREFGDLAATLYSTGGSGGDHTTSGTELPIENSGNGGVGGYGKSSSYNGSNGSSGIIVIRNHRE